MIIAYLSTLSVLLLQWGALAFEPLIFSFDPLVIYLKDYISPEEASHLLNLNETDFKPSLTPASHDKSQNPMLNRAVRDLLHVIPDRQDSVIQTLVDRTRRFQGFSTGAVESPTVLRYKAGGHVRHHYDHLPYDIAESIGDGNRATAIFAYLTANCTGGGTNFPRLSAPRGEEGEKWCEFIDCDEPWEAGVTFRPIAGNAVFWNYLYPDGTGHTGVWHAGLPVTSGVKDGLNIWIWTNQI